MDSDHVFTIIIGILTIIGNIVVVWSFTRKNASIVAKERALGEVKVQAAEVKERSDLIEMLKESNKSSVTWLETLKVTEHKRELDYNTLKAIIEDGTQETINGRKELLKSQAQIAQQVTDHNTGVVNILNELKTELGFIKTEFGKLPERDEKLYKRVDSTLGYIDRLLPKLRQTGEMPAANGTPAAATPTTA